MMLLIRSMSTGVEVCESGSRYWPLPAPLLICWSGGGSWAPLGRGWVGAHSTNFSPISDCGRIVQVASERKSWKPGSVDAEDHGGLLVLGDVEVGDLADLHAGDLHVLAGDHRDGVVEDRAHLVGAAGARAGAQHGDRHRGAEHDGHGEDALHGPGGTRLGSHWPLRLPSSRNGAEPSAGVWLAAPGQRWTPSGGRRCAGRA